MYNIYLCYICGWINAQFLFIFVFSFILNSTFWMSSDCLENATYWAVQTAQRHPIWHSRKSWTYNTLSVQIHGDYYITFQNVVSQVDSTSRCPIWLLVWIENLEWIMYPDSLRFHFLSVKFSAFQGITLVRLFAFLWCRFKPWFQKQL